MDKTSFSNVKTKWINELKNNAPRSPIILVGTKLDLKNDKDYCEKNGVTPVTKDEMRQF